MLKQTLQRGFTLIELLVVIAIIGILAAVVLTSLSGAQEGAQNSNVQQSLGSIRAGAQLYYNQNQFSYEGLCATDANPSNQSDVKNTLDDLAANLNFIQDFVEVESTYSGSGATDDIHCNDTATAYAVSAPLLNDGSTNGEAWCVDSTGFQGNVPNANVLAFGGSWNTSCQ